jgi:hypothetical protein
MYSHTKMIPDLFSDLWLDLDGFLAAFELTNSEGEQWNANSGGEQRTQ